MRSLDARRSGPFAAVLVLAAVAAAHGCGDGEERGVIQNPSVGQDAGGTTGGQLPGSIAGSTAGTATTAGGGQPGGVPGGTTGGISVVDSGLPNDAGTGTTGGGASSGLPCNIEKIVGAKCAGCHSDPPQSGAFMPLIKQSHWQAQGFTDKTKKFLQLAQTRVNSADRPMPPVNVPALTAEEKTALNAWLTAGAPASTEVCAGGPLPKPDAGVDPSTTIDTTGLECYKFVAHAQGSKTAKYKVGAAVDKYMFFGFQAPWQGTAYGLVVKPVIDNTQVVHHWLLYKENVADGSVQETIGQHNGGELIHGWAPGGIAMDFREHGDVSFELPGTTYGLELHYNSSDANAMDASGAEICIQKTATKNIATMSWLGYDQGGVISYATGLCLEPATMWTGTCRPVSREPINLIYMTPHLHQSGRHLKSIINGPNGSRVLHDAPFDFASQVTYKTSEVLMPGETITTTCTFSAPNCAGQSTMQEMCYNFVYAYPKHALVDNGPEGTLMHGKGVCLGQ